jgi:hypothetical protein
MSCICKGDGMYGMVCSEHPREIVRRISTRALNALPLGILSQIEVLSNDVFAGFCIIRVGAIISKAIDNSLAQGTL